MARRASSPRPHAKTDRSYFGWIYEMLQTAQSELEQSIRATRLDVAARIGELVSESFEQHGWTRETLIELSTWLRQRGADFELCSPENLARMKRLHELEERVVASDRDEILNPCLSTVPPEDLEAELDALLDPTDWHEPEKYDDQEEEDELVRALEEAANDESPASTKRH